MSDTWLVDRVGGPMRYLESSADVVRALLAGEREITSRVTNLAHMAEAMAREVVKPRIAKSLGACPLELADVEEVEELAAALVWSAQTSAGLHGLYGHGANNGDEEAS